MTLDELKALASTYTGLAHALEDASGTQMIPLGVVSAEPAKPIDRCLLATILEEYHHISGDNIPGEPQLTEYHVPCLYIVWKDEHVEKSDRTGYRCERTTRDSWSQDILYSGITEDDQDDAQPIGSHFVDDAEIQHVFVLDKRSSRWDYKKEKVEGLTIKVFMPDSNTDIVAESRRIMEIWESYGESGLADYTLYPNEWDD